MLSRVLELFFEHSFSLKNKSVVLAVSGGKDSMAMLHFFSENRDYFDIKEITAAHFNHGLRGAASDSDEWAVREFAKALGISVAVGRGKMNKKPKPKGHGEESWGRELRYAFLQKQAAERDAYILTAHNRNDLAETVLFHLARGTGLKGASGIPFRNKNIVRPMLNVPRDEIELYVKEHDILFCEDETNSEVIYSRNRIRKNVLPELLTLNSRAVENIAGFSSFARQADEFLVSRSRELLKKAKGERGYCRRTLLDSPMLLTAYALREMCKDMGFAANERMTEEMKAALRGEKSVVQLNREHYFVSDENYVSLQPAKGVPKVSDEYIIRANTGRTLLPGGEVVFIEKYSIIERVELKINGQFPFRDELDCDRIDGDLVFRSRVGKDRFESDRRNMTKSVKKLFNERKIPVEKRGLVPLLADDSGIVWIDGEGVSKRAAADKTTKNFLGISISREQKDAQTPSGC